MSLSIEEIQALQARVETLKKQQTTLMEVVDKFCNEWLHKGMDVERRILHHQFPTLWKDLVTLDSTLASTTSAEESETQTVCPTVCPCVSAIDNLNNALCAPCWDSCYRRRRHINCTTLGCVHGVITETAEEPHDV